VPRRNGRHPDSADLDWGMAANGARKKRGAGDPNLVDNQKHLFIEGVRKAVHNQMLLERQSLAKLLDPSNRDLDESCGYPTEPTIEQYKKMYDRESVGERVVSVYPSECWSVWPEVYETEDEGVTTDFERAWAKLLQRPDVHPWHYLQRVDEISGIGRYGVIMLGLDDGLDPEEPVAGFDDQGNLLQGRPNKHNLNFLRTYDESTAWVTEMDGDPNSSRYGQPTQYKLWVLNPKDLTGFSSAGALGEANANLDTSINVHWTRVVHIADNCKTSEAFGVPRMRSVFNRLLDIRKIAGGSAEMFWKNAAPGYAVEALPNIASDSDIDSDSIREVFQKYFSGLERWIGITGASVKPLAPQIADPTAPLTQQLQLVCATIGCPLRIFLGAEAGHLASTQDAITWNRRVARRQRNYLNPMVIRRFIDRLVTLGVLPRTDDYTIEWNDLNALTDQEKADVALKLTQSLLQYVTSGAWKLIPPREYFVSVMRMTARQAAAIIKSAGGEDKLTSVLDSLIKQAKGQGRATNGTDPTPARGGGNRNALGTTGNPTKGILQT
jgi:hypothetical protein